VIEENDRRKHVVMMMMTEFIRDKFVFWTANLLPGLPTGRKYKGNAKGK
jgi:hypothetical protein